MTISKMKNSLNGIINRLDIAEEFKKKDIMIETMQIKTEKKGLKTMNGE